MIGNIVPWIAGFAAGAVAGALYLGLLWAGTRALEGPRPARVFVALTLARVALVLGALAGAVALGAGAGTLAAGLAGFVAARAAVTRSVGLRDGRGAWR